MKKVAIALGFSLLLLTLSDWNARPLLSSGERTSYLPSAQFVRLLSLGHTESLASLYWIEAVIQYGGAMLVHQESPEFKQYCSLVTTLSPKFKTPYWFLGAVINLADHDTLDLPILDKGRNEFPDDWKLSLNYALRLANKPSPNTDSAAQVMARFAQVDTVPQHIQRLSESFRIQGMPKALAVQSLLMDYGNPALAAFRLGIENKLHHFLDITDSSQIKSLHDDLEAFQSNPSLEQLHTLSSKLITTYLPS